jgi:hypothetical protein
VMPTKLNNFNFFILLRSLGFVSAAMARWWDFIVLPKS